MFLEVAIRMALAGFFPSAAGMPIKGSLNFSVPAFDQPKSGRQIHEVVAMASLTKGNAL